VRKTLITNFFGPCSERQVDRLLGERYLLSEYPTLWEDPKKIFTDPGSQVKVPRVGASEMCEMSFLTKKNLQVLNQKGIYLCLRGTEEVPWRELKSQTGGSW
jgi:hypothetical protein